MKSEIVNQNKYTQQLKLKYFHLKILNGYKYLRNVFVNVSKNYTKFAPIDNPDLV